MSSRRRTIIVLPEANDDIDNISIYGMREWGESRTTRYLLDLAEKVHLLAERPHLGAVEEDVPHDVRAFPVGRHDVCIRSTTRCGSFAFFISA